MNEINVLRNQVKRMVDNASEKDLELMYRLFEKNTANDWWDEISPEHQKAINKGLKQLDNDEGIPHEEVMKKYSKWLK